MKQMQNNKKIHSVTYIAAIRDYLLLRTEVDDLSHGEQIHLAHLAMRVRMDGTASVGYAELQKLRLARYTIAKNNKKFIERGIISRVDVGHSNQYGKSGKVSRYHFDLVTILRLNEAVLSSPRELTTTKVLSSLRDGAEFPHGTKMAVLSSPRERFLKERIPERTSPEGSASENFRDRRSEHSPSGHSPGTQVPASVSGAAAASENYRIKIARAIVALDELDHKRAMRLYRKYDGGKYPETIAVLQEIEAELLQAQPNPSGKEVYEPQ